MSFSSGTRTRLRTWAEVSPQALAWAEQQARGPAPEPSLARHRTGWAAEVAPPGLGRCVLKVYLYPGLESLRGFLRTTFLAPSRPAREGAVLAWLAAQGLGPELALAAGERRRWGWLTRAWLLTRFWEAPDLASRVGQAPLPGLAQALGSWLGKAHALGLEDRNPHLRNFLARVENGSWRVAKVDSPKAALGRGPIRASARQRDLARLCADAERLGVAKRHERAFLVAYRREQAGQSTS